MTTISRVRATYLLVCRDASNQLLLRLSSAEMAALLHQWLEWHDSLQAAGKLRFSSPVEAESSPVCNRLDSTKRAWQEQQRPLIGYLLIEAESLEDATSIAQGCPGLSHGFVIEVYRPLDYFGAGQT